MSVDRAAGGVPRKPRATHRVQSVERAVELRDTPETRGMIQKVRHLVTVEESASAGTEPGRASARPRRSLGEGGKLPPYIQESRL